MMPVNVALVPVHPTHDLVDISKRLAHELGTTYVLGANSLPHCTLAQFEIEDPRDAWRAIESLHRVRLALTTTGTYASRSSSGKLWFGFEIAKTPELVSMHEDVLRMLALPDTAFHAGVREAYRPHFSLGVDLMGTRSDVTVPWSGPRSYLCDVHLGASGPEFQFDRILF